VLGARLNLVLAELSNEDVLPNLAVLVFNNDPPARRALALRNEGRRFSCLVQPVAVLVVNLRPIRTEVEQKRQSSRCVLAGGTITVCRCPILVS